MKTISHSRSGKLGFTLVELLVVIAIIGILAGLVVPNVVSYLQRGQVARAASEVRGADTALGVMLSDSGRSSFRDFLTSAGRDELALYADYTNIDAARAAQVFYNTMFYDLLKNGRNATFAYIDPSIRQKLGTNYIDIGPDPWDHQYNFWMGPYGNNPVFHRSYRLRDEQLADDPIDPFIYDDTAQGRANAKVPGNPAADDLYGFPAPRDKRIYISSLGPNQLFDAFLTVGQSYADPDFYGGGDDINNWDSEAGWDQAPR